MKWVRLHWKDVIKKADAFEDKDPAGWMDDYVSYRPMDPQVKEDSRDLSNTDSMLDRLKMLLDDVGEDLYTLEQDAVYELQNMLDEFTTALDSKMEELTSKRDAE
tara:strand:- start:198 stop:512 length:315 start_codon:yes stop_codon:yes gene_type:complete